MRDKCLTGLGPGPGPGHVFRAFQTNIRGILKEMVLD